MLGNNDSAYLKTMSLYSLFILLWFFYNIVQPQPQMSIPEKSESDHVIKIETQL